MPENGAIRSLDLRRRRDRLGVHGGPGRARTAGSSTPRPGPADRSASDPAGAWDGEVAYWRSPLSKQDLFRGGLDDLGPLGPDAFRESLTRHVAGLQAVTPFETIYLSGQGLNRPDVAGLAREALAPFGRLVPLPSLPGAWVKHAAQGSALLADALAGGRFAPLADALELRSARGTIWDAVGASRLRSPAPSSSA